MEALEGRTINTTDICRGRVTLVSCEGTLASTVSLHACLALSWHLYLTADALLTSAACLRTSQEQCETFTKPAWEAFKHDPDFNIVRVRSPSGPSITHLPP